MMHLTRRQLAAGLAVCTAACASRTAVAAQPAWTPRASLPWTAQEIYPCLYGPGFLVAGGLRGGESGFEAIDRVALYDAGADAWTEQAPLPEPRHHPILIPLGEEVLAIGGFVPSAAGFWTNTPSVLLYHPAEGGRASSLLPAPQSEAVGAMIGGVVHLVTGRSLRGEANGDFGHQIDVATHLVFDPASGVWETARPAPTARNSAAGAVIDGALHVVGGRTMGGGNLPAHERYDPRADRWDTLAPMPQGQGGLAAAILDGRIFAFGGEYAGPAGAGVFRECWIYDAASDSWSAGPDMVTPRHGLGGLFLDGRVYAIAGATGYSGSGTSAVLEALGPV